MKEAPVAACEGGSRPLSLITHQRLSCVEIP
ncbi:Hypothetical protein Minf_0140 [Methylacidiphilum infernorum V4]|uniref:Uncharacterized protein n=1 Tax=Methylacidiphilum infernorum (isolate V4) TaxID=481448 RepID=B3DX60_METI4|nr:Hypothetical protein Minf_0140 [Methylacidiphilum infernorum V4]